MEDCINSASEVTLLQSTVVGVGVGVGGEVHAGVGVGVGVGVGAGVGVGEGCLGTHVRLIGT